jgi:hypothetical protein
LDAGKAGFLKCTVLGNFRYDISGAEAQKQVKSAQLNITTVSYSKILKTIIKHPSRDTIPLTMGSIKTIFPVLRFDSFVFD